MMVWRVFRRQFVTWKSLGFSALLLPTIAVVVSLGVFRTSQVGEQRSSLWLESRRVLAVGAHVPALTGQELSRRPVALKFEPDGPPVLICVFTADCLWCRRNTANVLAIADQTAGRLKVIAVSLDRNRDAVSKYVERFGVTIPVLFPSRATVKDYQLGPVPTTILVSATGRVEKVWQGPYTGEVASEMSKALAVRLPGLLDDSQAR